MSQNPYEKVYDDLNIIITEETTLQEAETLARHLGHVYNTFGLIVKDFITLMGYRFRSDRTLPSDKNKKDKKIPTSRVQTEKKSRSVTEMEQEQLEGKSPTPPIRPFNQIQNYNHPGNSSKGQNEVSLREKINRLKDSQNGSTNQTERGKILDNKDKTGNENNIMSEKQKERQNHSQNQKESNIISNHNPQDQPSRKVVTRRKRDHEVINISSQDEQKDEDSLSGVKTRAQHRGEHRPSLMRPDSLLRRGRGRGRGRGRRPSSRGSSRVEEDNDERKEAAYPLHPNDPFTIIYNVPYRQGGKINSNGPLSQTPSKKDQKMEKRMLKQISESSSSHQLQHEQIQPSKPLSKSVANHLPTNQSLNPSPYNNPTFIQKVMASYMQEKHIIKEKLDNLDREYEKQRISFMNNKIGKHVQDNSEQKSAENGEKGDNARKPQQQAEEQEDGYEYEVEEEISFEQLPQQEEEEANFDVEQEVLVEQEEKIVQEQEEQPLPFEKLNPSPKPKHTQLNQSYNYLQQINQSIQQEFEENLRMNQHIDFEQNDNQYEEEVSYSSPAGLEAQNEPAIEQIEQSQGQLEEHIVEKANKGDEEENEIVIEKAISRKPSEVLNIPPQANNELLFEDLFKHVPNPQSNNNPNQRKPSRDEPQPVLAQPYIIVASNSNLPTISLQPQPQSYFPFANAIPSPITIENLQPLSNQNVSSKDNKEELLRVLDEFESDPEDQPKKDVPKPNPNEERTKPTLNDEKIRQALISKLTSMRQNNETSLNHLISVQNNPHSQSATGQNNNYQANPMPDKVLQQQNNSLSQNKPIITSPQQSTLPILNQASKPLQNPAQENKKPSSTEFIPFIKKSKHIEVIELE